MRIIPVVSALALALSSFGASAYNFAFSAMSVSGHAGGTTNTMTISLQGNYAITGGEVEYRFDRTKFLVVTGSYNGGICEARNDPATGIGSLHVTYLDPWGSWVSTVPRTLCQVRFEITAGTPLGYYPMTLQPGWPQCVDTNGNMTPCTADSGAWKILVN